MDLFEAARKGREAAFLELFDEHHLPLFRFAYRLTGSVADAEDVVQECFLELLRPGCSYDPGRTALRTYLFGVVRNQALKRRRKSAVATGERSGAEGRRIAREPGSADRKWKTWSRARSCSCRTRSGKC